MHTHTNVFFKLPPASSQPSVRAQKMVLKEDVPAKQGRSLSSTIAGEQIDPLQSSPPFSQKVVLLIGKFVPHSYKCSTKLRWKTTKERHFHGKITSSKSSHGDV